jgi:hypothetical protein
MLRRLHGDLYDCEVRRMDRGVHLRLRMVIVRLPDGSLFVHSPVPIDEALAREIDALGGVAHVVAPNLHHSRYAAGAKDRYPEAKLWGAPGLREKKPEIPFDATLWTDPMPWSETLDAIFFEGIPWMNETVFLHRPSRTAIFTDAIFNVHDESHFFTRVLWRAFGIWKKTAQNRAWKLKMKDRDAYRATARKILAWDFDRATMAHGDVIERGAHREVERAFAWLG